MTAADLDPRPLLDLAVARVLQADGMQDQIDAGATSMIPTAFETLSIRQQSALSVAATLAAVADALVRARADERAETPARYVAPGDEEDADDEPEGSPDDGPHALACRFTADMSGALIGTVGGRKMLFVRYVGWIDMIHADHVEAPNGDVEARIVFRGRAISRYNDRILVITGGGFGMVLPADVVTLEADE